jgi:hypothetical protein
MGSLPRFSTYDCKREEQVGAWECGVTALLGIEHGSCSPCFVALSLSSYSSCVCRSDLSKEVNLQRTRLRKGEIDGDKRRRDKNDVYVHQQHS